VSGVMSKRQFVDALADRMLDVSGETRALDNPPGRSPSPDLVALSEWFRDLDRDDRAMAVELMRWMAYGTLHGALCVLDGVAAIEGGPAKGQLRLLHESHDGVIVDLTYQAEPMLHDLLAERR